MAVKSSATAKIDDTEYHFKNKEIHLKYNCTISMLLIEA